MKELDIDEIRHLRAAEGWIDLGSWIEANLELDEIKPELRSHPAVLQIRYEIYAKGEKWDGASEIAGALVKLLPDKSAFWICLAYATRRKSGGGISQAKIVLSEAQIKFPKDYLISFNLACYECQLGDRKAALRHLEKAIDLAGKKDIRAIALNDQDLEPLWNDISEI
jgi:tetratricopeptide (TPR) repeat protein